VYGLNHSGVLLNLGRAYLSLKRLDDALDVLSQVMRATAEDWRTQLGVGKLLFENLLYDDAKPPLDMAWQLNPDSYEAGFYRALVHYLLGDQAESLKVLLELRTKNPQSLDTKNLTAAVYARLGRTGEAVKILKETIEAAPDQPAAYLNLGLILLEAGQLKEAKGFLEQGGARYTGKGTVFYTLGTEQACSGVYRSLDEAHAPKQIEQVARDRANFYLQLGKAFEERFHYTSAAELLRIGWELDPDNFDILLTLGICCYNLDDLSSSVAMFRRAVSLRPDSDRAYYFLGNAYASLGNDDEAVRAYRQAIRIAPQNPLYLYRLGKVLFRNGQTHEALAAYRSALSLSPEEAAIHSALGKAYLRLKREDLALSEFREAIRLSPGLPEPYYNLAQYYGRKRQTEQAEKFAAAFARKTAIARRTPGQYGYIRATE
jgi:tetratricopeptide (TPR) repeat protein